MRIGPMIFGCAYLAALLAYREWRAVMRHTLFRTPWRQIACGMFDGFPSSHWRGVARIIGVPFAWFFAALVVVLFGLLLIGIELIFTPQAVYYSLARLAGFCLGWFTHPPGPTPPHSAALAMPRPQPPSITYAISRLPSSDSRRR